MPFTLTARWPGAFYLGHAPDGTPETIPSPARVFSALVHSAGTANAVRDGDGPHPEFKALRPESVDALLWLEQNSPKSAHIPAFPDLIPADASLMSVAFRKDGVFLKEGKRVVDKTTPRLYGDSTWCSKPIAWIWDEAPSPAAVAALDALCAGVSHLGEGDSPVILEVFTGESPELPPTHRIVAKSFFDRAGVETLVPAPGRLEALERLFRFAYPAKRPSAAQDRHNVTARPQSEQPISEGTFPARLIPLDAPRSHVPWAEAVLLPVLDGPVVPADRRIGIAVHLHRALIAAVGQDCPPIITGKYGEHAARPANRVSLHYIPAGAPLARGESGMPHFAVLVPRGMPESEKAMLYDGIARLRDLRSRVGRFRIGDMELVDGAAFWSDCRPGFQREWRVDPVAVPERLVRGLDLFDQFSRAALLSITNVFRDDLVSSPAGDSRQEWIAKHGVTVLEADPYLCLDPTRFVHRTNHRIPAAPYTARIDLGSALPETAVCAIGQSRHLGGGLLIPVDRPARTTKEQL